MQTDPGELSTTRPSTVLSSALGAAMLRSSVFPCVATDLQGTIQLFNAGAERLLGYTAAEAINRLSLADLCNPKELTERARLLGLQWGVPLQSGLEVMTFKAAQGVEDVYALTLIRKDGGTFPASMSISALRDEQGAIIGFLLSANDNSYRVEAEGVRLDLEAQLRESQKREALGTLAGGIAHDFNNILAVVLGNAELAHRDAVGNPSVQDGLEEIRKAGTRGRELVQQLLTFVRKKHTARVTLALVPVVLEAARLLRATLPARLQIEVDCEPDVPPILADSAQIMQVLINLATNAMQSMPTGPGLIRITLGTARFDVATADSVAVPALFRLAHPEGAVRLTLSDTGLGMDENTRRRIFDPFFTTKAVGEGAGLGLTIVSGILQSHDGVAIVQSQPGKGASFSLFFPIGRAEPTALSAASVARAALVEPALHAPLRILYIDDDPALTSLVKRLLERRGEQVTAYLDAKQALAALRTAPAAFDLVLSDYNMPDLTGLDVAREVRAIRPGLPVAITTGYVDEALQAQAASAGVREVIFKAESVEQFCDAVQRVGRSNKESS